MVDVLEPDSTPVSIGSERGLARIMTGLGSWSLLNQACSLLSSIVLARILGATSDTDAYYLALAVPALATGVLSAAVRNGAIASLTEVSGESGHEMGRATGELLSAVILSSALLTLVATGVAELVLPLLVDDSSVDLTRLFLLELAPYGILGASTGVLCAALAVRGVFSVTVAVLAFEPAAKTALMLVAGHAIGAQTLVMGNLIGSAAAVAVLWHVLWRRGTRVHLERPRTTPFVRDVARLSGPLVASSSILVINPVVDRTMASSLGSGSVTSLEMGLRLAAPLGVFTSLLAGPLAARWSARKLHEGLEGIAAGFTNAINAATAILPPIIVAGVCLRREIVVLLFQGGAYSMAAVRNTAGVFGMIVPSIAAQMLILVMSTLFLIMKDLRLPMKLAFVNVALNTILNFALRPMLGVKGIALSTTITLAVLVMLFAWGVRNRWGSLYRESAKSTAARLALYVAVGSSVGIAVQSLFSASDGSRLEALISIVSVSFAVFSVQVVMLAVVRDPLAFRMMRSLRLQRMRWSL